MHRQNIFLAALLLALLITIAFRMFPALNHSDVLGWMYFPAIVATVLMSGNSHAPSEVAGWITFIVYTLMYWGVVFVIYAVLLELYLIRSTLRRMDHLKTTSARHPVDRADAIFSSWTPSRRDERSKADNLHDALQRFGEALSTIENRRRGHIFLRNLELSNLNADPSQLGAHALAHLNDEHVVKALLKHFQNQLAREIGAHDAAVFIDNLKEEANARSQGASAI